MRHKLIPYNSELLPLIDKTFDIQLPKGADIRVGRGDCLTLKDLLAKYEDSPIVQSFNINHCDWDFRVLHGELVKKGNIIAKRKGLFSKGDKELIANFSGVIDLKVKDKLLIHEDYREKDILAGFSGVVDDVDRLNFKVRVVLSGAAVSPLFVHNLPLSYSCSLKENSLESKILFHKDSKLFDYKSKDNFQRFVVFDYLEKDEFDWINSNIEKFKLGFCVLTSYQNIPRIELFHDLFDEISDVRLFWDNGILFTSIWKSRFAKYKYAKVRKGSKVIVNHFNKSPISGKIISFKGDYILIETEDKEEHYLHYLNVFKE